MANEVFPRWCALANQLVPVYMLDLAKAPPVLRRLSACQEKTPDPFVSPVLIRFPARSYVYVSVPRVVVPFL